MTVFTIVVCPNCEERELPSGSFRARCPNCGTLFSRDDERPADRDEYPEHWERRLRWRYPVPGKRLRVTAIMA